MQKTITVREHREVYVTLSKSQVSVFRKNLVRKVDITPTGEDDRYILRAGSNVGFVKLPDNSTLIIEPKIPVQTILLLLSMVYDPSLEFLRNEEQAYSTIEGLFEFVVRIFLSHIEDLIARGILKGYRSQTDDLTVIRGRLLISETLHRKPVIRDRHWCRFSLFTANIYENIILRSTAYFLQAYRYQDMTLHGRIRRVARSLSEVTIDPEPRRHFERLEFHRLNDPYRPALNLAKLILDHIMFSGSEGEDPFVAFLIDMNWLFEKVVWTILRQHTSNLGVTAREQKSYPLDNASKVKVKPDVILYRHQRPKLVLDAKYKLDPNLADIYQVLAYCHALDIEQAILVHPESEQIPTKELIIRRPGEVKINYLSVDLSGNPSEVEFASKKFVEKVNKLLTPTKSLHTIEYVVR